MSLEILKQLGCQNVTDIEVHQLTAGPNNTSFDLVAAQNREINKMPPSYYATPKGAGNFHKRVAITELEKHQIEKAQASHGIKAR